MMNIIFLDIDGVLNCENTCTESFLNQKFDSDKISILNEIIEKTNSKIVISSAWRIGKSLKQLQKLFKKNNIKGEVIGSTISSTHSREFEIQEWLNNNLEVSSFIVIDDDDFDVKKFSKKLIHTDFTKGLELKHISKAILLLCK